MFNDCMRSKQNYSFVLIEDSIRYEGICKRSIYAIILVVVCDVKLLDRIPTRNPVHSPILKASEWVVLDYCGVPCAQNGYSWRVGSNSPAETEIPIWSTSQQGLHIY